MSVLNDTTVNGRVTQTQPANQPHHLVRLAEIQAMLASNPGPIGNTGPSGASVYGYVGYASDTSGTGFSLTPGGGLNYIAFLMSPAVISSPTAANFTGLWKKYAGADGATGAAGADGASVYPYVGYATDNIGTGFSLTPGSGLNFVAFLMSSTVIASPDASNFTGLWKQFVGATGATGADGAAGAAGAAAYFYIAYASDTSGTGFSLTPGAGLNFVAFLSTTTVIPSPNASNFTGLWKNYTNPFTVTGPVTLTGGAIGVNAASANTVSYLVQRDSSGNFAAGTVTLTSLVVGSSTLAFASSNLTINTAVTIASALTLTGLSGVLKAASGVVAGGATTDDLTEGSTNQYFTATRARATALTGLTSTNAILATDTILAAFGKLDALTILTGYTSGAGTVAATDTLLQALQKLNGNQVVTAAAVAALNLSNPTFTGTVTLTQSVVTSGSPNLLVLTGAAHTTLAGGVEATDAVFDFNRTVQFNTGALTLQRAARFEAPTYAFVGASTLSVAATVHISGCPKAGTNATITTSAALKIFSGAAGSGVTNAYGLYVDAPTGATNNYCAAFNTGDVLVNAGWLRCATSYGLKVNSVQVVTGRQTGWTAATGTATRTSFATSSVTLPNLAQAVKALIDDLTTHGLIGT